MVKAASETVTTPQVVSSSVTTTVSNPRAQQDALNKPFDPSRIKKVTMRGKSLDYIPVADVVQRMNDVLGTAGWSVIIEGHEIYPEGGLDSLMVRVRVLANIDGKDCEAGGIGGAAIKRSTGGANKDMPVALGDDYKSATSEAIKKACQRFGVGLHLALPEDQIESADTSAPAREYAVSEEDWDAFIERYNSLGQPGQAAIKERWAVHSNKTPTRETIAKAQFAELTGWVSAQITAMELGSVEVGGKDAPF